MHLCWIDWGSICLLYICIVLDLAVGVAVCKHLCSIDWGGPHEAKQYSRHLCLTEGYICLLYICNVLDLAVGVAVCKHLCSIDHGGPPEV